MSLYWSPCSFPVRKQSYFYIISLHEECIAEISNDYCSLVAAKSGVDPSGCIELVKHVKLGCPNLKFSGLMTIGMADYSSTPENFRV